MVSSSMTRCPPRSIGVWTGIVTIAVSNNSPSLRRAIVYTLFNVVAPSGLAIPSAVLFAVVTANPERVEIEPEHTLDEFAENVGNQEDIPPSETDRTDIGTG